MEFEWALEFSFSPTLGGHFVLIVNYIIVLCLVKTMRKGMPNFVFFYTTHYNTHKKGAYVQDNCGVTMSLSILI